MLYQITNVLGNYWSYHSLLLLHFYLLFQVLQYCLVIIVILVLSILCMVTSDQTNSNVTNSLIIHNIPVKKVHVGDIDIAYKTFGKGDPFFSMALLMV